ncbi:MAG: response regulator [Deltaproteobacteria bacterium]|nr:MAG: response regulator [Deltaproteobacteria bacterium]
MAETTHTLMIVDDEDNVRSALRRTLRRERYELVFAASGDEALQKLEEQPVDLIISDHLMPGMTGLELLKSVRNLYPDIMRIILTGHADLETAISAINQGEIYRFLTKPWDDLELKVTLQLALEHLDLERENRRLLSTVRRQSEFISRLEETYPGIAEVRRDSDGAIVITEEELAEAWSL